MACFEIVLLGGVAKAWKSTVFRLMFLPRLQNTRFGLETTDNELWETSPSASSEKVLQSSSIQAWQPPCSACRTSKKEPIAINKWYVCELENSNDRGSLAYDMNMFVLLCVSTIMELPLFDVRKEYILQMSAFLLAGRQSYASLLSPNKLVAFTSDIGGTASWITLTQSQQLSDYW